MHCQNSRSALFSGFLAPLAASGLILGCSGGGGGTDGEEFLVQSVNLAQNSIWAINRPITIQFTAPVDFSSVSLNAVNIRQVGGAPAVGEFLQLDATTIAFQPVCPRLSDLSDAGFRPGGVQYELNLQGNSAYSVRSMDGQRVANSEQRLFRTPDFHDPAGLFFDSVVGSPVPVIRSAGSADTEASHVELGGDPGARVYFEREASGVVALEGGFQLPLNLQSDRNSQIALILAFNQPVDPSTGNINATRLRLEYLDQTGNWQTLESRLALSENCSGPGARVRIEPQGALPPGARLRCILAADFRDIAGEINTIAQTDFAPAQTANAPAVLGDALEEEFIGSGTAAGSREDPTPPLGLPRAIWGDGALSTAFGFSGTGGPGGDFDFEVKAGQVFVLDTASTVITGGPNFVATHQQVVVGGVVDVRNFRIGQGGTIRIQGRDPVRILASGTVQILGTIEVSGTDSRGVSTLGTTNIPEPGAPGVAGGGSGGTGSPLTHASSPKGTEGEGAFGLSDLGGGGGEASFWTGGPNNEDARRGTGGGGGRLGLDQINPATGMPDQTFIGLDAEPGFNNLFVPGFNVPAPIGVVSGTAPPKGGAAGPSPMADGNPADDFHGAAFDSISGSVVMGELLRPWAGAGGGGGGDAIFSNGTPFPVLPFVNWGDEKGAGGGGAGGSLQILALGTIRFGPTGSIKCRGGTGGGGENTLFINRVGGGSGGGSGGHVILQTAAKIDFTAAVSTAQVSILATGGQGGAGAGNLGGAKPGSGGSQETTPLADACPAAFPLTQCLGPISGAGGDGGPGIIQLHTPHGLGGGDILLPPGRTLADLCKPRPVAASATQRLIPSFGRASIARSVWIPMGVGGFDPGAVGAPYFKPATFALEGVDPSTGRVATTAGRVDLGSAVLGPASIEVAPALPFITLSGRSIVMDASPLLAPPATRKYLLDNPGLLKRSTLRLAQVGVPANHERFDVVSAVYDANSVPPTLTLTTSGAEPPLTSFGAAGGVTAELIPTHFKVTTGGQLDSLPDSAAVYLKFQAAPATSSGVPDTNAAVPSLPGSDAAVLNAHPNNAAFRFLRFQVEFDIDALNQGISPLTPLPALDFLRLPFRY
ncbi:MAG: hypothetical protein IPK67_01155 [Planctomycetes bacterium]|nr:hypothetical protein [Planctomycetota bacterium]